MKKLFIKLFMLTGMALACANTLNAKNSLTINPLAGKYQRKISAEELVLNNGAKWKVDNSTDRSLKAYKKAGNGLQNGLAKMIKECRMHGPDHLALHKWLEPLMAQVTKLEHAPTNAAATQSTNFIRLQLSRYNQFFEL